jgi:hypothetical protein
MGVRVNLLRLDLSSPLQSAQTGRAVIDFIFRKWRR